MILAARGAATIWVRKSETLQKVVPALYRNVSAERERKESPCCDAKWAYQRNMCGSSGRPRRKWGRRERSSLGADRRAPRHCWTNGEPPRGQVGPGGVRRSAGRGKTTLGAAGTYLVGSFPPLRHFHPTNRPVSEHWRVDLDPEEHNRTWRE